MRLPLSSSVQNCPPASSWPPGVWRLLGPSCRQTSFVFHLVRPLYSQVALALQASPWQPSCFFHYKRLITRKMAENGARLAYVIVYVPDVNQAAEFYKKAFGLEIRPQNKANSWIEMETGATTLAFTPLKQHETKLIGGVSDEANNTVDICLNFPDVEAAYKHAISQGAKPVAEPEDKPWMQKVSYVKDIYGNIVRMGSFVAK